MASRTSARTTLQRPALAFAPHGDCLSPQRRVALPPRRRTRQPASLLQPEPVTLYYHAASIHFRPVRLVASAMRRTSGSRPVREQCRSSISWNYFTFSMRSADEGQKGSALVGPATPPTPTNAPAGTSLLSESYESLRAAENTERARFPVASVPRTRVVKRVTAFLISPAPTPALAIVHAFVPWKSASPEHHLVRVREVLVALFKRTPPKKADRLSGGGSPRRQTARGDMNPHVGRELEKVARKIDGGERQVLENMATSRGNTTPRAIDTM
ncbi:hypothetical protein EDB83DRAFT_2314777 [Lactarius deliciosus]|nr:hypothetical protein EDB83DRAFT_2314777 [Lactarius deliciosus]